MPSRKTKTQTRPVSNDGLIRQESFQRKLKAEAKTGRLHRAVGMIVGVLGPEPEAQPLITDQVIEGKKGRTSPLAVANWLAVEAGLTTEDGPARGLDVLTALHKQGLLTRQDSSVKIPGREDVYTSRLAPAGVSVFDRNTDGLNKRAADIIEDAIGAE